MAIDFSTFGFWVVISLAVLGVAFLPAWLWLLSFIIRYFREFVFSIKDLLQAWCESTIEGFRAIYFAIIGKSHD